ncbi:TetR/AcrR family transcriptional regulator [Leifsonia poae]|uniref:TetR/AcrR family transcriptional regulator n=1 Tax=Leifsonia poae TaxID=110933 RepID=UPI001CC04F34|nr:TetR/AcrR family transcriptional regulator [Leifsonia poae]
MAFDRTLLWPGQSTPKRGPKPKTSLERIVDAAIGIADADGLAAVSMQRVADEIGATKMSLYRYVPGKSELTALMLDKRLGAPPTAENETVARTNWRADLTAWTVEIHRRFLAAPWALELAVGARVIGPNELAWYELGLTALAGTPLRAAEQLDVLALLSGHVRSIVQQQVTTGAPEEATAALMMEIIGENATRFPHVASAFAGASAGDDRDNALAFGTERILDGIQQLIVTRAG